MNPDVGSFAPPRAATLYAPLIDQGVDGTVSLIFTPDHPGYSDPWYQARRSYIAKCALARELTDPPAHIEYDEIETQVWVRVRRTLRLAIREHACAEVRDGLEDLQLPEAEVPQLRTTGELLTNKTGFCFGSAAGIAPIREFYGALADGVFCATQYIRHPEFPDFSPEPDMIHEISGHGAHLMNPRLADLYRAIGVRIRRAESADVIRLISKMFWFTIETGLISENGELKALGASLVSSSSDLAHVSQAHCLPLNAATLISQDYAVDSLQGTLFYARSLDHLEEFVHLFLDDAETLLAESNR